MDIVWCTRQAPSRGGAHIAAFVVGMDGNVWMLHFDGVQFNRSNQGSPPGKPLAGFARVGVTTVGDHPCVFVTTNEFPNSVWVNWRGDAGWQWTDLGSPVPTGRIEGVYKVGALTQDGVPTVYVLGGRQLQLWSGAFTGQPGAVWTDLGRPAGGMGEGTFNAQGAIQLAPDDRPYALAQQGDGTAWMASWSAPGWAWFDLGTPPGQALGHMRGCCRSTAGGRWRSTRTSTVSSGRSPTTGRTVGRGPR